MLVKVLLFCGFRLCVHQQLRGALRLLMGLTGLSVAPCPVSGCDCSFLVELHVAAGVTLSLIWALSLLWWCVLAGYQQLCHTQKVKGFLSALPQNMSKTTAHSEARLNETLLIVELWFVSNSLWFKAVLLHEESLFVHSRYETVEHYFWQPSVDQVSCHVSVYGLNFSSFPDNCVCVCVCLCMCVRLRNAVVEKINLQYCTCILLYYYFYIEDRVSSPQNDLCVCVLLLNADKFSFSGIIIMESSSLDLHVSASWCIM